MNRTTDQQETRQVDMSILQALQLTLELGGEPAEVVANAPNEVINELMNSVDTVRIIV